MGDEEEKQLGGTRAVGPQAARAAFGQEQPGRQGRQGRAGAVLQERARSRESSRLLPRPRVQSPLPQRLRAPGERMDIDVGPVQRLRASLCQAAGHKRDDRALAGGNPQNQGRRENSMNQFDEYSSDLSLKRQADSLERIEKLLEKLLEVLKGRQP